MQNFRTNHCVRLVAILALVLWGMVYADTSQRVDAQALPSLIDVLATIPADAITADVSAFILNGQPHAAVRFSSTEQVDMIFRERTIETDREYLRVYRWDGTTWQLKLDGYPFAASLYGSRIVGPLDAGSPTSMTALVSFRATPLPQRSFDPSSMPDLLALELHYELGPTGVEHPAPTLAILLPTPEGFTTVYTTDFSVRASIEDIYRVGESLVVRVPAYVSGAACCPDGTEYLRLMWRDGRVIEADRCIRPGRAASLTSCAVR